MYYTIDGADEARHDRPTYIPTANLFRTGDAGGPSPASSATRDIPAKKKQGFPANRRPGVCARGIAHCATHLAQPRQLPVPGYFQLSRLGWEACGRNRFVAPVPLPFLLNASMPSPSPVHGCRLQTERIRRGLLGQENYATEHEMTNSPADIGLPAKLGPWQQQSRTVRCVPRIVCPTGRTGL